MRPLTTLKSNPQFKLTATESKTGFNALYNGRVGMQPYDFMFQLTSRVIWGWASSENADINAQAIKDYIRAHVKDQNRTYAVKSTLRRNNATKSLEFRTPIFHKSAVGDEYLIPGTWAMSYKFPAIPSYEGKMQMQRSVKTIEDTPFANGTVLTAAQVISLTKLSGRAAEILKNVLVSLEAEVDNGVFIIWATWKIPQKEAEYLNNVPFAQINLGGMYPTLLEWTANCIGKDANLPDTICPISTIVSGVEGVKQTATIKPRVGMLNAVIDVHRHIYIIPETNNAFQYEQQLLEFGQQEDGSYTWGRQGVNLENYQVGEGQERKKLPVNMPIYADWLNDKFVYSNSAGNLAVYDLSTTVPVNNFHVRNLLDAEIDISDKAEVAGATIWTLLCTAVDHAAQYNRALLSERPTQEELPNNEIRTDLSRRAFTKFRDAAKVAIESYMRSGGDMSQLFIGRSGASIVRIHQLAEIPAFNWLFRIIAHAKLTLEANIEAMYTRYSVLNSMHQLAILSFVVEYSPKKKEVNDADNQEREVYLNQGVDPEYGVEGVPNIKNGLKYLPHQAKIQNLLRRGPKLATIPVDAGGGKTIAIMTNILLEIKRGHCRKPIIMCPSHLVAQYVKEAVFVTEGRVNIIPVTNASLKLHGEEKLKQFLERAPLNSIVVTDFNFIRGRKQRVAYGNKTLEIYRNAEFMRQFEFDLVAIDECHYLKNIKSARRDAAARFMQDIPMKRIASGTMVSDTMTDLVSQIALLDPVIFGDEELFKDEFALERRGNKVMAWKPGAEKAVRKIIGEHAVVAGARRKEWAALLPPKKERFIGVELTKNQRLLYESILQETMELIQAAMARDAEVRDLMESEDDSKAEELEARLRPYLARLERFMSAPEVDPAAQLFLKDEDDLTSPKVKKVYEICREHLNNNIPGKILIFTQYTASAESIALNAPPDLKPYFIHYTASMKAECKTEFENDDSKRIMVGVSSSMDTGLNLQFASRLIRMETVWTPGILEQGNARINRPELKKAENRNTIYFDWLVINRSIDITKVARLVSKIVSKAKFDEYDNPNYEAIPSLPQVAMTMDSIAANNDFTEELLPYLESYEKYQQVEEEEFAEYKRQQGDKIVPIDVPQGGMLAESKLMSRVPYVPEMELYGVDKLGLVRYDQFMRQDITELEEDTEDEGEDNDEEDLNGDDTQVVDPKQAAKQALRARIKKERSIMKGRPVHTDFGDGEAWSVGRNKVWIKLADGTRIKIPKLQVFVITRSTTNSIDMRNELLKQVGKIPLDAPIQVPVEEGAQDKKRKIKKIMEKEDTLPEPTGPTAEFDFTVLNDFLALMFRGDGSDSNLVSTLQNFGFRVSPHYNYVRIPGPIRMLRLMKKFKEMGFKLMPDNSQELKRIYEALKTNKTAMSTFGFATKMDVTNFYRQQLKPSSDQTLLKIYPLVQDGKLFLLFPTKGQPANQKAKRAQVSGLAWKTAQDLELVCLLKNKQEAKDKIKEMTGAGIVIPPKNLKELETQFKSIRLVVR